MSRMFFQKPRVIFEKLTGQAQKLIARRKKLTREIVKLGCFWLFWPAQIGGGSLGGPNLQKSRVLEKVCGTFHKSPTTAKNEQKTRVTIQKTRKNVNSTKKHRKFTHIARERQSPAASQQQPRSSSLPAAAFLQHPSCSSLPAPAPQQKHAETPRLQANAQPAG